MEMLYGLQPVQLQVVQQVILLVVELMEERRNDFFCNEKNVIVLANFSNFSS